VSNAEPRQTEPFLSECISEPRHVGRGCRNERLPGVGARRLRAEMRSALTSALISAILQSQLSRVHRLRRPNPPGAVLSSHLSGPPAIYGKCLTALNQRPFGSCSHPKRNRKWHQRRRSGGCECGSDCSVSRPVDIESKSYHWPGYTGCSAGRVWRSLLR